MSSSCLASSFSRNLSGPIASVEKLPPVFRRALERGLPSRLGATEAPFVVIFRNTLLGVRTTTFEAWSTFCPVALK
jgi:hypothetical protein